MTEPNINGNPDSRGGAPATTIIREAIILAGGLGTRLRSAVPELPKCMAPVAGRPFIAHVVEYYRKAGIEKFIFALGYKSAYFDEFLQSTLTPGQYSISLEDEPLGTGGAIRLAATQVAGTHAIILNGDTFFDIDLAALSAVHKKTGADCTLTLKPMREFDRYGVVELIPLEKQSQGSDTVPSESNPSSLASAPDGPSSSSASPTVPLSTAGRISHFLEKQYFAQGLINGGVYALNVKKFRSEDLPEKFSFEKDYLERLVGERKFVGLVQDKYFIDIGIPADYDRAQHELA
jgi:D-glycero-alpha-D-manno-heptose 1-phosphate guanylyltransferase